MHYNVVRFPTRTSLALIVAFAVLQALTGVAAAATQTTKVTFVVLCDIYKLSEVNGRGGYARLAGAVNRVRAKDKNVVVVHAGDAISPSLFSGFDKGAHTIDLLNRIGLDVFVPGNHEFDFGKEVFLKRMAEANFPLLAANLRGADDKRLDGFADTRMLEFDGIKLGVIGVTLEESKSRSSPGDLQFTNSLETIKVQAKRLKAEGAALIVVVAHADLLRDRKILNTGVVDVLLSGHDHDLVVYYDGKRVWAESKQDAQYVTSVELTISSKESSGRKKISWWPRFEITDTADVTPDPAVATAVAAYEKQLSKELDVNVGTTSTELNSIQAMVRSREAAIGNLITDAMRAVTGADVAIFNGGAIRGNTTYPAGTVLTRRMILSELPFGNKTVLLEMSGDQVRAALENGYWFAGKADGRFAQVSGLTVVVDSAQYPGKRIKSLLIGGRPVDPAARYTVATNDFLARGSEGYKAFTTGKILIGPEEGTLVVNNVMAFVRKAGTVSPKTEGRITIQSR